MGETGDPWGIPVGVLSLSDVVSGMRMKVLRSESQLPIQPTMHWSIPFNLRLWISRVCATLSYAPEISSSDSVNFVFSPGGEYSFQQEVEGVLHRFAFSCSIVARQEVIILNQPTEAFGNDGFKGLSECVK
jgi:hypothetical protein